MKKRILFTFIGIVFFVFGFLGFLIMAAMAVSVKTGVFDEPKPLYCIEGIAVDSAGNIYYGMNEHSSIQVYDNEGEFLYRYSFETGGAGYFVFYIDSDDTVYVATARTDCVYLFRYGELIDRYEYADDQEGADIRSAFEESQMKSYLDSDGNRYDISGKRVKMYDFNGGFVRDISPTAPIWPLPVFAFWGIFALGMLVVYSANAKFFKTFMSMYQHK